MYLVQALYWIHDVMDSEIERSKIDNNIRTMLSDKKEGARLVDDLRAGLSAMPIWMQDVLRKPLAAADQSANS